MRIQNRVVTVLPPLSTFPLLFSSCLRQSSFDLPRRSFCHRLHRRLHRPPPLLRSHPNYCYRYLLSSSSSPFHRFLVFLAIVVVARRALFFLSCVPNLSKTNPPLPQCSSEISDPPHATLSRCSFFSLRLIYRSSLNYKLTFSLLVPSVQSSPRLP